MPDDLEQRREAFFTPGVIGAMVVAVILAAALFIWAPWTATHVASSPGSQVTTGQSSTAPSAPQPLPDPGKQGK